MDPNIPRSKGPRRRLRSDVLGFGKGSKAPIPHVAFQLTASINELEGVFGDLAVDRGQVHDPVPMIPRADRRSEAWGPSSGGKADELHATLPRLERRTHPLVTASTFPRPVTRRATPSLPRPAGRAEYFRTSSGRTPGRGTRIPPS